MCTPQDIFQHPLASHPRGKGTLSLKSLMVDPSDDHLLTWLQQISHHQTELGRQVDYKMALSMGDSFGSFVHACAMATAEAEVDRTYALMACLLFLMCNQHSLGKLRLHGAQQDERLRSLSSASHPSCRLPLAARL
jgi:hypothetical protein